MCLQHIVIETHCQEAVNSIKSNVYDGLAEAGVTDDIRMLLPRTCNVELQHYLAISASYLHC